MRRFSEFIKDKFYFEPVPAVVFFFLNYLAVPVPYAKVRETLKNHPDYPNVISIVDVLHEFGINADALKGTTADLSESLLPAIALLKNNKFVLLKSISSKSVEYYHQGHGHLTCSLEKFAEEWSGVIVTGTSTKRPLENDLQKNRRLELKKIIQKLIAVTAIITVVFVAYLQGLSEIISTTRWVCLWWLKLIGLFLCILLVLTRIRRSTSLHRICQLSDKIDCLKIQQLPAGKLFGIPLSDIGLIYFAGGLLSLHLLPYVGTTGLNLTHFAVINVMVLPITLFSLYYQAFVIRSWCWMCVVIQILLWLEFYILRPAIKLKASDFTADKILYLLIGFIVTALVWSLIRSIVNKAELISRLTQKISRYQRSPELIAVQLKNTSKVKFSNLPGDIDIGPAGASITFTLVVNPLCPSCGKTFQQLKQIIRFGDGKINGIIRIIAWDRVDKPSSKKDTENHDIATRLVSLALKKKELALKALSLWFSKENKDVKDIMKQFRHMPAVSENDDDATAKMALNVHRKWADSVSITGTPTVYLNGGKLPRGIDIQDLKYYLIRRIR